MFSLAYQVQYYLTLSNIIVNTFRQFICCFVLIRSAGEVMAASLAQGGPCPNFMHEWCFRYLCSGDADSILVSASDVTDLELSLLVERVSTILSKFVIAFNFNMIWLA